MFVVGACSASAAYMVNVLTANTYEGSPMLFLKGVRFDRNQEHVRH